MTSNMWREELKRLGHENDGAYVGLMEWFDQNPGGQLSTFQMGQLGLKHWRKGRSEWSVYNQATLERKARDLRSFGLLDSYSDRGYVYFKAKDPVLVQIERSEPLQVTNKYGELF